MNCIEARRMVAPYVKGELSDKELENFLKHIEQCEDCMDELDIYFTFYRAMDLLDTGEHREYDFKKMLEESLRMSRRRLLAHKISKVLQSILFFCTELLFIFCIISGFQMSRGNMDENIFQKVFLRINRPASVIMEEESDTGLPEELSEKISEMIQERRTEAQKEKEDTQNQGKVKIIVHSGSGETMPENVQTETGIAKEETEESAAGSQRKAETEVAANGGRIEAGQNEKSEEMTENDENGSAAVQKKK